MIGIDTACDVRPHLDCITQAGYLWVGRYLASHTAIPGKILTPIEAKAIADAGLSIVSIWENGSPTSAAYFTAMRGLSDGTAAKALAESLGQPEGTLIYATVDYDALSADLVTGIRQYFQAFMGAAAPYLTGVYGSGSTCEAIVDDGYAVAGWLSEASGWSGYRAYREGGRWAILQSDGAVCELPGDVTDKDTAQGVFGAWQPIEAVV